MADKKKKKGASAGYPPGGKFTLKKEKKKSPAGSVLMWSAVIAAVGYCSFTTISERADIAEKQKILERLRLEEEQLRAENTSYQSIIDEDDERAYMERIAIEVLGYAYPSERRFYDTTRS